MAIAKPVDKAALDRITMFFRAAERKIQQEITTSTDFGRARRLSILKHTQDVLKELTGKTETWINETLPKQYTAGAITGQNLLAQATVDFPREKSVDILTKLGVFDFINSPAMATAAKSAVKSNAGLEFITQKLSGADQQKALQAWADWVAKNPDETSNTVVGLMKTLYGITPKAGSSAVSAGQFVLSKGDNQAIAAIANNAFLNFGDAISGMDKSVRRLMNDAQKQLIRAAFAEGRVSEDTLKQVADSIQAQVSQGFVALQDRSGKTWAPDVYARMLARTKMVETTNTGLHNRLLDNGYDLVQVSDHNTDCQLCAPWEGEILSLTGATAGYPTLDEAEAAGLFHPNCEHRTFPYHPAFAEGAQVWNGQYYADETDLAD